MAFPSRYRRSNDAANIWAFATVKAPRQEEKKEIKIISYLLHLEAFGCMLTSELRTCAVFVGMPQLGLPLVRLLDVLQT